MRDSLAEEVKFNCDVSDAKYWGYFSLCGLLMRLRDLYRSEKGLNPWAPIDQNEIAGWIARKEARWAELESGDFTDLQINGTAYHPFDIFEINLALKGTGLVYGAGYGVYMKPNFLLAELRSAREIYDYNVYLTGKEHARDLFVTSGMLQGRCIFLRLEPLRMFLWGKYLEFKSKRSPSLDYAFRHYGVNPAHDDGGDPEKALEEMVDGYSGIVLFHELAEAMEDLPEWPDMLVNLGDRDTEFLLRALKDLIADTSDHGPIRKIIENEDKGAIGLYVALAEGYRKTMYPEMNEAFEKFILDEDWRVLEAARESGHRKFLSLREAAMKTYKTGLEKQTVLREIKGLLSAQPK